MFAFFQCVASLLQLGAVESKMNDFLDSPEGIFNGDTFYNPMLSRLSGIHSFLYLAGFQGEFYCTMCTRMFFGIDYGVAFFAQCLV